MILPFYCNPHSQMRMENSLFRCDLCYQRNRLHLHLPLYFISTKKTTFHVEISLEKPQKESYSIVVVITHINRYKDCERTKIIIAQHLLLPEIIIARRF